MHLVLCSTCGVIKSSEKMDTATRCIKCADRAQQKNDQYKRRIIVLNDMMAVWATKEMR